MLVDVCFLAIINCNFKCRTSCYCHCHKHVLCIVLFSTDNEITEIQGLSNCLRLEYLSLKNNKIDRIQGLDCLPLKYLNLVDDFSLFFGCCFCLSCTSRLRNVVYGRYSYI